MQGRPNLEYENKKLTGLWHLEYTGADLAKEFVMLKNPTKIRIAIVDSGITKKVNSCGSAVRTNISDLSSYSDSIHAQIVADVFTGEFGASNPTFITTTSNRNSFPQIARQIRD